MNHYILLGFICSFLLVSFAGSGMAEDSPGSVAYLQGGQSIITNGTDGMTDIIVQDLVPYVHVTDGKKSILIPVQQLTNMTAPMNAALVLSGEDKESTFVVEVSNLSLSDGNNTLTLLVKPLEFYEGDILKSFAGDRKELEPEKIGKPMSTGIYIEIIGSLPTNKIPVFTTCTRYNDRGDCIQK